MDLGSVLSRVSENLVGKKNEPDKFLAVKISSGSILATVWTIESGKVVVGEVGTADITNSKWETLLQAADQAVSTAIKDAPLPSAKTIFAIPFDWVTAGKINPEHLKDLRQLCKELDLSPQGFVVVSEALENFYKEIEGAPLTAILIGIDGTSSSLTMYRAGKNLGTLSLSLSKANLENIPTAVESALDGYSNIEVLPSRIIIYNGKSNLEDIADKLTAHHWSKKLPFLHFPKVEIAPAELVVKAVAVAGGIQMGGKFEAVETELTPKEDNTEPGSSHRAVSDDLTTSANKNTPANPDDSRPENENIPEIQEVAASEAGFLSEGEDDVINIPIKQSSRQVNQRPSVPTADPSALGQLMEMPSKLETKHEGSRPVLLKSKLQFKVVFDKLTKLTMNSLTKAIALLKRPTETGSEIALSKGKRSPLPIIIVLVFALLGLPAAFYFLFKTNIIITVAPRDFNQQMVIVVVTDSSDNTSTQAAVLTGQFIDVSELGTKKGVTTGKKLVGDKAKGSVTIYSVGSGRSFPSGSSVASPTGLKFTLDHEVSVASGDAITPATISTTVSAVDIGDAFNLPSGTKFSISNLPSSQYLAKNDSAFTGGSSHQATVVTKQDQDRLFATLSAELTNQAKANLESKVAPGQSLLPNAVTSTVSKKRFSKEIDAEADTLNLDLTMDFRGIVFSQSDLVSLFTQKFATEIPPDLSLDEKSASVEVLSAESDKKNNSLLTVRLAGKLLPVINKPGLIQKISGKNVTTAKSIIENLPNVASSKFEVKPRIFSALGSMFLPWKKENIQIEIVTD